MNSSLQWVERTIESAKNGIVVVCGPTLDPTPITDAQRAAIAETNVQLPASMRRWLEFDAGSLDLFDKHGDFVALTTLPDFLLAEFESFAHELDPELVDEMRANLGYLMGDFAEHAGTPAIVLPGSASQAHVLLLDGSDEPPVLGYEKEEFWEKYPSFGACVAHIIGNRDYEEIAD